MIDHCALICAGQSTITLEILLRSLVLQWNASKMRDKVLLHTYVLDTDVADDVHVRREQLQVVVDDVNKILSDFSPPASRLDPATSSQAVLFQNTNSEHRVVKNFMYGYDESESLLQYLMHEVSCCITCEATQSARDMVDLTCVHISSRVGANSSCSRMATMFTMR